MKELRRIFILLLICSGCAVVKQKEVIKDDKANALLETQYFKVFTEATKHALLGSYRISVNLFNACIKQFPDRPAPYYQLSSIYLRSNNLPLAKEYAEKAVRLDSLNVWYIIQLANIYQYNNEFEKAIEYNHKALKIRNDDQLRYNLSLLYNKIRKNSEAIDMIYQMDAEVRESKEVLMVKHNIFHQMMNYDSAIISLKQITQFFPEDITGWGMLAEYLSEIGRNEYAKHTYKEIIDRDPNNSIAYLSFGEFYLKNKQIDSAFILFEKAMVLSDLKIEDKISFISGFFDDQKFLIDNLERINNLLEKIDVKSRKFPFYAAKTDLYMKIEDFKSAQTYIDSALIYEKSNYNLWEQAIIISTYLQDNENVIRLADECFLFFKDKPMINYFRANALHREREFERALVDIDTILYKSTEKEMRVQAYNLAAEIFRDMNQFHKSDSCFENILSIDSENLIVRNNYAYYLSLREENLEKAEELSIYTIEREPENATYLDTYGWILYKLKKYELAKSYIEKSIRKGAYNNAEVLEHYGDIMLKVDKCKDAIEAYEKALLIEPSDILEQKVLQTKKSCN